jgi:predicted amidohydrolase
VGTGNLELDAYNDRLCGSTPAAFAVATGLPVVHSSLVGRIGTRRSLSRDEAVERRLVGAAMIAASDGRILASVASDDSDGIAVADIDIGSVGPRPPAGEGFWIPRMRDEYLKAWEAENRLGEQLYFSNREAMIAP